jgi:hypothetical protein
MGEAKRRQRRQDLGPNGHYAAVDAPEIRALLEKGQPINVHLMGAMAIIRDVCALNREALMAPERHAFGLAFQMVSRIDNGEIEPWTCFLCDREFSGLPTLSVMAVIERALGDPMPNKPGLTMPICHACDSVSTEETRRRVQAALGLYPLQEGRA